MLLTSPACHRQPPNRRRADRESRHVPDVPVCFEIGGQIQLYYVHSVGALRGDRVNRGKTFMTATFVPRRRTLVDLLPQPSTRAQSITRDAVLVVGFAVFTAVLAQIRVNLSFTPVPITGQTLGVLLAGTALGWSRGASSQLVYWVAGVFMPVAWYADDSTGASVSAGWKVATGPTAGYLLGFVVAAAAVGYLAERRQDRDFATSVPAMLAGTAIIYVCGAGWLAHDLSIPVQSDDGVNALAYGVTPFLVGDLFKLIVAGAITPAAWRLAARRQPGSGSGVDEG
jgi:biotin transport system substrate-specific component